MESTLVIKVKYGDTLRRFNARVNGNEQLDLDMGGLRAKIISLFNLPPDAELTLTYIDEDGDRVTLVDDDDLHDVVTQDMKFLRIDVQLDNEKFANSFTRTSESSTAFRSSSGVQHSLPRTDAGITEMLKSVPEPLCEALAKLSLEFASKTASSTNVLTELVDCFLKMGMAYLNPDSQPQRGVNSRMQDSHFERPMSSSPGTDINAAKDGGLLGVLPLDSTSKSRPENVTTNVAAPVTGAPAHIDLNLDLPCDFNLSGATASDSGPSVPAVPSGDQKKAAKESGGHLKGKSGSFDASTSFGDPIRPPLVYTPHSSGLGGTCYNECPFTSIPVTTDSSLSTFAWPPIGWFKKSHRPDALGGIFHKGIRCDVCGANPITGPRYKSKVKENYDLCSICFSELGNETDYIKMDRPVLLRHARALKGLCGPERIGRVGPPAMPHILGGCGVRSSRPKLDSRFLMDVNVLDGTVMVPSTCFTKIWRMQNNGTLVWPRGLQLVWIGGDRFSDAVSFEVEIPVDGVPIDGELDVAVDFTAPELPGRYVSYWRMASPSGVKFGQRVWVLIEVDASFKDSACDSFQGLNLNMPPESSSSKGFGSLDINVQPSVDVTTLEHCSSSSKFPGPEKQMGDEQPKKKDLNFTKEDRLLAGQGASATPTETPSSYLSYPIIDLSETAHDETSSRLSSGPNQPSSLGVNGNDVEETMLKELEAMGFKQVDLNKEILKNNEYNLEQSVDALCGVSDWDPILEELLEMGFCDEEVNKKLLKKNNGSIKHVVMDLLSGEEA